MAPLFEICLVLMMSSTVGLGFSAMHKPRFLMLGPPLGTADLMRPKAIVAPRAKRVSVVTIGCASTTLKLVDISNTVSSCLLNVIVISLFQLVRICKSSFFF